MSIITNHKRLNPSIEDMIADFIASKGVIKVEKGRAKGSKSQGTKHVGKPNYGMKNKRYA